MCGIGPTKIRREKKIINFFSIVSKGRTVWLVATEKGYLVALQIVWVWAKDKLRNRKYN